MMCSEADGCQIEAAAGESRRLENSADAAIRVSAGTLPKSSPEKAPKG